MKVKMCAKIKSRLKTSATARGMKSTVFTKLFNGTGKIEDANLLQLAAADIGMYIDVIDTFPYLFEDKTLIVAHDELTRVDVKISINHFYECKCACKKREMEEAIEVWPPKTKRMIVKG